MAFTNPSPTSRPVLSIRDTSTAAATVSYPFLIPQDADSIVAKIWLASGWNASGTATITLQTSEDGGSTWRDVSLTTVGAATVAADFNNDRAHFIPIPCLGAVGRGVANYIGSVQASTIALAAVASSVNGIANGMPMLGVAARVQLVFTATITTGGVNVDIFAPTQEMR